MSIEIVKTTACEAPLDVVFDYVADYRNVPDWLFGVETFEPVGDVDHGLGAVFDAAMHLGMTLKSRIEVNAWVDSRLIGFDSIKGFKNSSRWNFERTGDTSTLITAEVSYSLPFGPAGKAMGKVIEPFVKRAVAHSSAQLKEQVEKVAGTRD